MKPSLIVFDIETVPDEKLPEELKPKFDPESVKVGHLKDPIKIEEKIMEAQSNFEKNLIKELSVNPDYCRILSLGYIEVSGHGEEIGRNVIYGENDETEILHIAREIFSDKKPLCGWSCKHFDIPVLWKRGIFLGMKIFDFDYYLELTHPYRHDKCIDLQTIWTDKPFYKLVNCTARLGIPAKTNMNGGKVYDAFLAGKRDEICRYNLEDCEVTLEIARRLHII